jgi:hypothetical protein
MDSLLDWFQHLTIEGRKTVVGGWARAPPINNVLDAEQVEDTADKTSALLLKGAFVPPF